MAITYVLYTSVLEVKESNDIEEVRNYRHLPTRLAIAKMASCHTGKAGKSSCPVDTAFDATSLPSNTGTAVASVVLPLLDGNFTPRG